MTFFKPSAKAVAKKFYDGVPGLAGTLAAAMPKEFSPLQEKLENNNVFAFISMNLTTAALIEGVSRTRGARFAQEVSARYMALDPTVKLFLGTLEQSLCTGTPFGKVAAEAVYQNMDDTSTTDVDVLSDYFETFRKLSQSTVSNSVQV